LETNEIVFLGSGSVKFKSLVKNEKALFSEANSTAVHLANLAQEAFHRKDFADLAYAEPLYIKEFYSTSSPSS
jgi:tRNA threonylcarbamoyladenosine biosynthesis protein TsaB